MRSSVATLQVTSTAFRGMPPPRSNGRGAIFVQSTKPSGAGSPAATPSAKGEAAKTGLAQTPPLKRLPVAVSNAAVPRPRRSVRRFTVQKSSTSTRAENLWGMIAPRSEEEGVVEPSMSKERKELCVKVDRSGVVGQSAHAG